MFAKLPAAALQQITGWRYPQDLSLLQHVSEHGPSSWDTLQQKTGYAAGLWRVKWHTCWLERSGANKNKESYSDWELCVWFVACQPANPDQALNKKATFAELAKWLQGRSAAGLRQAYAHNVEGCEASVLAKLTANNWPSDLCSLLAAWPGPSTKAQAALDAATEANQKSVAAELIQELSAWVPHAKRHKSDPKPQTPPRSATATAAGTLAGAAAAAHFDYVRSSASGLLMGKSSADAHVLPAAAPSNGPLQQLLPQNHQQQPQPQMQLPGPMNAAQQTRGFIAGCAQDVRGDYTGCAPLPSSSVGQARSAGVDSTMVQRCWDSLAAQIAADLAETEDLPSMCYVLSGPGSAGSSSSWDSIGHSARHASVASAEQQEDEVFELLGREVEGTRGPAGVGVQNGGSTQQPHQQQQLLGTFAAMDCTPCASPGVQGQGAAAGIGVSVAPQASPAQPQGAPGAAAAAAAAFGGLQQQPQEVVPLATAMPQAQGLSGFLPYGQQQNLLRNTTNINSQPGVQHRQHTLHQSSLSTLDTLVPRLQAMSQQHQLLGQQLAVMHEELAAALAALHMFQAG